MHWLSQVRAYLIGAEVGWKQVVEKEEEFNDIWEFLGHLEIF